MTSAADPIVKWAGGKRRMVDRILPLVERRLAPGGVYHEPFLGGGAVALAIDDEVPVVARDACAELVEAYLAVARAPHVVHQKLCDLLRCHSESTYYEVRSTVPDASDDRAARFMYLNKTGFNGLYRVNASGRFNVPYGQRRRRRAPSPPAYGDLVRFSRRVCLWSLTSGDFEPLVDAATAGDAVYADPPYHGTFGYSSGFSEDDQRRLAECLRRAARRGVGVVATNADTPLVRRLYRWADVTSGDEIRSVAADGRRRGAARCVVAVRP